MEQEFICKVFTKIYKTKYRLHFIKITDDLNNFIKESGVKIGSVVIQTHHTTASLWVNEDEKNLIGPSEELGYVSDLKKVLDKFADPMDSYGHNDIMHSENQSGKRDTHLCEPDENGVINECINGHAHAQGMILQSSLSLIINTGKWLKGRWQELMLVEMDHNRERQVSFLIQGIK